MNEPARQIAAHDPVQTLATRYGQTYSQALHEIEKLTHTLRQLEKEHNALREHGLLIDADLGPVGNAAQAAWRTMEAHRANHAAPTFRAPTGGPLITPRQPGHSHVAPSS